MFVYLVQNKRQLHQVWNTTTQILRPGPGDVMITHGWAHMHGRVGHTGRRKRFIVRELVPCKFIKSEFQCMTNFQSDDAKVLKKFFDNSTYNPGGYDRVSSLNVLDKILDFLTQI